MRFDISPLNPATQFFGILIIGWLVRLMVYKWLGNLIWVVGMIAWIYFTFFQKKKINFW